MGVSACFASPATPFSVVSFKGKRHGSVCVEARRSSLCLKSPTRVMMNQGGSSPEKVPDDARNDGRATAGMFGIRIQTNGDVIKFGFIAIAIAYAFKSGLQVVGVPDLLAGQITTGVVSVASLLAWVST